MQHPELGRQPRLEGLFGFLCLLVLGLQRAHEVVQVGCGLGQRGPDLADLRLGERIVRLLRVDGEDAAQLEAARLLAPVSQFVEVVSETRDVVVDGTTYSLPPGTLVAGCICMRSFTVSKLKNAHFW